MGTIDKHPHRRGGGAGGRGLMVKQLARQVLRNKIFVALLLLLIFLTAVSFFFIRFSIDGNLAFLQAQPTLADNQQAYHNALTANIALANNFLLSFTGLTSFVFVMFYYRFFRSCRKEMGCLKALGFRDSSLRGFFVAFAGVLSLAGELAGLCGGYFLADVQLGANGRSYNVTGLVKSLSATSVVAGLAFPAVVFCVVAFLSYGFVRGREAGALIAGDTGARNYGLALRAANAVSAVVPVKNKFPLRIALRKPLAVLLVLIAAMSFSVCMVIGQSLHGSSRKVLESQTLGHNYQYRLAYGDVRSPPVAPHTLPLLELPGAVEFGAQELGLTVAAPYGESGLLALQDRDGLPVAPPAEGGVVIGPGLWETYGVKVGDALTVTVQGERLWLEVTGVAANAQSATVYVNAGELTGALGLPLGAYNVELGEQLPAEVPAGAVLTTRAQRAEQLSRDAVSNNVSGVINQATGMAVGCILLFLALYTSFRDNTHDMLVLHMLGYRIGAIRRLLVNVYLPIVWAAFLLTLAPSIGLARGIQRMLSIATNDYMPFAVSAPAVLLIFGILNVIYLFVQAIFGLGIRRIIQTEDITRHTGAQ